MCNIQKKHSLTCGTTESWTQSVSGELTETNSPNVLSHYLCISKYQKWPHQKMDWTIVLRLTQKQSTDLIHYYAEALSWSKSETDFWSLLWAVIVPPPPPPSPWQWDWILLSRVDFLCPAGHSPSGTRWCSPGQKHCWCSLDGEGRDGHKRSQRDGRNWHCG